jgi:general secretion pathway protein D
VVLSWQGPAQAKPGDTISLTLNAQSAEALSRLDLLVSFDPAVLRAVDVTEGGFLRQGDQQSALVKTIDQASGQILVDVSGMGADGVSGTGSVATLVFEAIAEHPQTLIAVGRAAPSSPGGGALVVTLPQPHVITVAP